MNANSNLFILGWAANFVCNDKAYIYDGYSSILWQFEPCLNNWTEKAGSLELGYRTQAIGFSIDGNGYIGLGKSSNKSFNDVLKYDPQND